MQDPYIPEYDLKNAKDILNEYMNHLSKTIKRDKITKLIVFLTSLSTYCKQPLNLFLRGFSSIGKTYNVTESLKYFPQEYIWLLGGLSPTALYHDFGVLIDGDTGKEIDPYFDKPQKTDFYDKEGKFNGEEYRHAQKRWRDRLRRAYYVVDLSNKILVFLEAPHRETFNKLRPILSHDAEEISYKFTDRPGGGPLQTMHVVLRGWPATIFCTTDMDYVEDLATRSFTHTPDMTSEKYQEAVLHTARKAAYPWLDPDKGPEFENLKGFMTILTQRMRLDNRVVIPFAENLANAFQANLPRDMRDFKHFQVLIETSTLLHLFQRHILQVGNEKFLIASLKDLKIGLELYRSIESTTRAGIAGHIIAFFDRVILPLWELKQNIDFEQTSLDEPTSTPVSHSIYGLTYKELMNESNEQGHRKISTKRVSEYVEVLREIGWIDTQKDPEDKRRNLVSVIKNHNNRPISSVGTISSLFTAEDFKKWLDSVQKYSSEEVILLENVETRKTVSLNSVFSEEYLIQDIIGGNEEIGEIQGLILPSDDFGRIQGKEAS